MGYFPKPEESDCSGVRERHLEQAAGLLDFPRLSLCLRQSDMNINTLSYSVTRAMILGNVRNL